MRSSCITQVDDISNDRCSYKQQKRRPRHRGGSLWRCRQRMAGCTHNQRNTWSQAGGDKKAFSWNIWKKHSPTNTVISEYWPLTHERMNFCGFSVTKSVYFSSPRKTISDIQDKAVTLSVITKSLGIIEGRNTHRIIIAMHRPRGYLRFLPGNFHGLVTKTFPVSLWPEADFRGCQGVMTGPILCPLSPNPIPAWKEKEVVFLTAV